jgi:hypothetical protein
LQPLHDTTAMFPSIAAPIKRVQAESSFLGMVHQGLR